MSQIGDKPIVNISLKNIADYKMQLAVAKKSASFIAGELSAFCSYFEFLRKTYRIKPIDVEDIKDLRPKVRPGEPVPLDMWQYSAIMEQATTIEDITLLTLLFNTGLRISEALSLTRSNVIVKTNDSGEDATRWLKFRGKGDKERIVPLNKEADAALTRYLAFLDANYPKGQSKLFNVSYTTAWRRIKAIGGKAGVTLYPHMFRHTFATELLKRGENIAIIGKIMGHESLDTTRKYTKLNDVAMVAAVENLIGRYKGVRCQKEITVLIKQ